LATKIGKSGGQRFRHQKGKAPTIADVANLAGYSPMTVSRVINGESRVKPETRESIMEAVRSLNYVPNSAARSLAGGNQMRLALIIDNPSASYLSELLLGAMESASQNNIHLEVHNGQNPGFAVRLLEKLADNGTDGFILPPPLCDDQRVIDLANELGVVTAAVGPGRAIGAEASVFIDDYSAAKDMTRHIIQQGHKRIGFITGNPEQAASERRLSGYLDALGEHHIDRVDDLIGGFDDTEMASTIWPELTTIRQPIREMSGWALNAAVKAVRAKRTGTDAAIGDEIMPYKLIERDSDAAISLIHQIVK